MIARREFLRMSSGLLAASAIGGLNCLSNVSADCTGATLTDSTVSLFRSSIQGSVILPADSSYWTARLLFSPRFDPYPVAVVRAANESDVARTIEFARVNNIKLAIRSGGHSYIGASACDGIVLDLSQMNQVTSLGGAHFRIGSGTQLQNVYGTLRCDGNWTLPCGSCDTVGFGGIAQGGGFGYLQRSHGLTCDRVRSARVVLADGSIVTASPNDDADLYWAIRGAGGGSLGVVTQFDVEAIPYQNIHIQVWYWPLSLANEALNKFVSLQQSGVIPRSATAALVFNTSAAMLSPSQCLCVLFSTGTTAEALAVKKLFVGGGGIPETPGLSYEYDASSPACDPHAIAQRQYYRAKSAMVFGAPSADTGDVIRAGLMQRINGSVSGGGQESMLASADYASINFLTFGGAVSDLDSTDASFAHRDALLEVQFLGYVTSLSSVASNQKWIQDLYADVFPRLSIAGAGCYVNYADEDLLETQWPLLYWGDNYGRLQQTKLRVDPSDFFRHKQSIKIPS